MHLNSPFSSVLMIRLGEEEGRHLVTQRDVQQSNHEMLYMYGKQGEPWKEFLNHDHSTSSKYGVGELKHQCLWERKRSVGLWLTPSQRQGPSLALCEGARSPRLKRRTQC
jgi:hypothetical protein